MCSCSESSERGQTSRNTPAVTGGLGIRSIDAGVEGEHRDMLEVDGAWILVKVTWRGWKVKKRLPRRWL